MRTSATNSPGLGRDDAAKPAATGLLDRVIDWSARNVFLVLLATLFLVGGGIYAVKNTPLDALPDLSDVQVIVYTDYPGQAPQVVEDQITYPLTTSMLAVPRAKVVRGFSMFGASYVYVIFEDGTDIYWARSRVLEYLSTVAGRLPQGVAPQIGPDATGVGWVYQYAVQGKDMSLADTRSLQDWFVRYQLTKAQGVSEVASLGGFVREYQVTVDPLRLPVLMLFFVRGRILPEARNPVNRLLIWLYRPIIKAVLRFKGVTLLLAILAMVVTIIPARQIGSRCLALQRDN